MTTVDLRCPQCGAALPAGATWCSLCFTTLAAPSGPVGSTPRDGAPAPAPEPPSGTTLTAPALPIAPPAGAGRGRHRAGAPAPAASAAPALEAAPPDLPPPVRADVVAPMPAATDADQPERPSAPVGAPLPIPDEELAAMFAELRASEPDPLAKIAGVADKKSQRVAIGLGGTIVLVSVFLLAATALGFFLNR